MGKKNTACGKWTKLPATISELGKNTAYVLPTAERFRHPATEMHPVVDAPQKAAVISTHCGVTTSEGTTFSGKLEFLAALALFLIHFYRYYFVLEEGRALAPFSITVTPCDVPIEWSILVHKASASLLGKVAQGKTFGLPEQRQRKPKLSRRGVVTESLPQA